MSLLLLGMTPTWSWTPPSTSSSSSSMSSPHSVMSRRDAFLFCGGMMAWSLLPQPSFADDNGNVAAMREELKDCQSKLKEIPILLQAQEWDKVRSVLKTPPVNKLWNLGDSQNTVLKLAKETGDVELFELKDELAYNLQMTDQLAYDNVFVYFQPGSGKIKIKEPTESANKAISYLEQIISATNN